MNTPATLWRSLTDAGRVAADYAPAAPAVRRARARPACCALNPESRHWPHMRHHELIHRPIMGASFAPARPANRKAGSPARLPGRSFQGCKGIAMSKEKPRPPASVMGTSRALHHPGYESETLRLSASVAAASKALGRFAREIEGTKLPATGRRALARARYAPDILPPAPIRHAAKIETLRPPASAAAETVDYGEWREKSGGLFMRADLADPANKGRLVRVVDVLLWLMGDTGLPRTRACWILADKLERAEPAPRLWLARAGDSPQQGDGELFGVHPTRDDPREVKAGVPALVRLVRESWAASMSRYTTDAEFLERSPLPGPAVAVHIADAARIWGWGGGAVAPADAELRTFADLVAFRKANPGVSWDTPGNQRAILYAEDKRAHAAGERGTRERMAVALGVKRQTVEKQIGKHRRGEKGKRARARERGGDVVPISEQGCAANAGR